MKKDNVLFPAKDEYIGLTLSKFEGKFIISFFSRLNLNKNTK